MAWSAQKVLWNFFFTTLRIFASIILMKLLTPLFKKYLYDILTIVCWRHFSIVCVCCVFNYFRGSGKFSENSLNISRKCPENVLKWYGKYIWKISGKYLEKIWNIFIFYPYSDCNIIGSCVFYKCSMHVQALLMHNNAHDALKIFWVTQRGRQKFAEDA